MESYLDRGLPREGESKDLARLGESIMEITEPNLLALSFIRVAGDIISSDAEINGRRRICLINILEAARCVIEHLGMSKPG